MTTRGLGVGGLGTTPLGGSETAVDARASFDAEGSVSPHPHQDSTGRASLAAAGMLEPTAIRERTGRASLDGSGTLTATLGYRDWRIEGRSAWEMIDESRTWDTLYLGFRVNRDMLESTFRPLDSAAGKFDIVERPDGSYRTVNRASGENVIEIYPPSNRREHRTISDCVIESYEEDLEDQNAEIYNVELTFVSQEPKSGGDHGSIEPSDDEWHFAFADGDVSTDRVEREIGRGGETVEGSMDVSLVLEKHEAIVVEESLNRQAAVRVREVPDGQDIIEDVSDGGRATVEVTAPTERDPDERIIESGEYVVETWENTHINDEYFQCSLEITPKN